MAIILDMEIINGFSCDNISLWSAVGKRAVMGEEDKDEISTRRVFTRGAFDYLPDGDRYLSRAPEPQFGFAVIGCGNMGQEHIRNTILEGRARVTGVYDPAPKSVQFAQRSAAKMGVELPVYEDVGEILQDTAVDAVFICSPNFTHLPVLRELAGCGKAIFIEKPIATTVADAVEVCSLLDAHNALTRIGLQYRYKAVYQEAIAEVLQQQSIGRVHSVSMVEHRFPFLDKVDQWNKFNKFTGGTLIEKCCHYFDLLNLFAGSRPRRVFANGAQAVNFKSFEYRGEGADGLDQASVLIEYENGVQGNFNLCMFVPGSVEELTVCGDRGRLFASESARLGEETRNQVDVWLGDHGTSRSVQPHYAPHIHRAGHHGSTFYEHVAFVDDLLSGSNSGPSGEDALWSVVTGAAAQASIEQGQPVEVKQFMDKELCRT